MKKALEKNYDPSIEDRIYEMWLGREYFCAKVDNSKKPFTIVIPPPNITGQLHLGHAFDCTLQDILIRWRRMQGYNALWVPGTDHASIATEVKIVEKMASEGVTKADIGRDAFLVRAWEWRDEYGGKILKQLRKFGSSCDWSRERFTMDEGCSRAVTEVFVRLYKKGLIYRGERLVNWCPHCRTSISDAEVNHEDKNDYFYYLKYPVKGTGDFLTFVTTRPETMLGDTALAVHPDDERYKHYIGKLAVVPVANREIPIIADEYVDKELGTGVVKITPAHDHNDFDVGQRHNLPIINIMHDDGRLNENAGTYNGIDRYEARDKIVKEFERQGYFIKKEAITHAVGTHERCNVVVEPLIKLQWFVKMEELAKPAIEVYHNGRLRFIPGRFGKVYLHWLENIRDWCISRQLWWGHRIPAYYCNGEIYVGNEKPQDGKDWVQDEDTLDTWFSSALWPFSTLGWPDNTEDLKYFYPTDVLVTSYDIIFFWVVRMVFSGLEQMGELPFKDVMIHGLLRDSLGRKMSKSLGNGVDPLEIIEEYGADALRLTMVTGNAMGNDARFYPEKVAANRNFLNKIWNAARFITMNIETAPKAQGELTPADKWILSKINALIAEVTDNMENFELGIALSKIHDFIWDEFCDWYIEMVKPRLYDKEDTSRSAALWTLQYVFIQALKLLHPYLPFITEEIFLSVQDNEESIMVSSWPLYDAAYNFPQEEKEIGLIKEAVGRIRHIRAEMQVPPSKKVSVIVVSAEEDVRDTFSKGKAFFSSLAFGSLVTVQADKTGVDDSAVPVVLQSAVCYMPLDQLVDMEKEKERLTKEKATLEAEVERIEKKLSNKGFVSKAPENVVSAEKEKLEKYRSMLSQVKAQLSAL